MAPVEHMQLFRLKYSRQKKRHAESVCRVCCKSCNFFFAGNACNQKIVKSCNFFFCGKCVYNKKLGTRVYRKKKILHGFTIFLVHAFTAKKKNNTILQRNEKEWPLANLPIPGPLLTLCPRSEALRSPQTAIWGRHKVCLFRFGHTRQNARGYGLESANRTPTKVDGGE